MSPPRFAVVGHPNKGKSSIVATLARDDRVVVSPTPGTTTGADAYPMTVDGEVLYELVDTPGFQRSRRVLEDLRGRAATAQERPLAVRAFLEDPASATRYPDEHALLGAVMGSSADDPAGILYVVDGSAPCGPEYEAEMEILRWTGAPSLGLINPFLSATRAPASEADDAQAEHAQAWERALGQYFRIVRVFDPFTADHAKRLDLLRAFGQMREAWRVPLDRAVEVLERDAAGRREDAAGLIARAVVAAMRFAAEKRLPPTGDPAACRDALMEAYAQGVRTLETRSRDAVEDLYDFVRVERKEAAMDDAGVVNDDLFSEGSWSRFGATPAQLAATGAVLGGGMGVIADLHFAGLSMGAVAAVGAVIGGATAWAGATRAARMKVLGQDMGGRLARVGPSKNVNLAFVLLGRARLHLAVVEQRTHARRDQLVVPAAPAQGEAWTRADRSAVAAALKPVLKKPDDDVAAAESVRALRAWLRAG